MKKNWVNILLVLAAVGLGVAAWFLLPEVVAVQVGLRQAEGQPDSHQHCIQCREIYQYRRTDSGQIQ